MTARTDPTLRQRFYTDIWPKLLPTKSQLDVGNKFADDGRHLFTHNANGTVYVLRLKDRAAP